MTDREPSWDELESYLLAGGWSGRWITSQVGRWQPPLGGPVLRIDMSQQTIGVVIVHIADREGRGPGDVRRDIIDGTSAEKATREPSEAEEIIAGIGLLAAHARESVRATRMEIEARGKNFKQSREYTEAAGYSDGVMGALADALEKHYGRAAATPTDGMPWNYQAMKYVERLELRLAKEAEEK